MGTVNPGTGTRAAASRVSSCKPRSFNLIWPSGRSVARSVCHKQPDSVSPTSSKGTDIVKRSFLLAAALVLAACGKDSTGPVPQTPAAVAVNTPQTIMVVGATVPLTASVFDQDGKRIANAAVAWRSLSPNVGSVSPSGVVTGISTGTVTIEAESSGRTGSVTISVEPDPCTTPLSLGVGQVRMLSGPEGVACIKLVPTSGPSDFLFITSNAEQKQDNTGVYSVALTQGGVAAMAGALRAMVFDPRVYLEQQAIEQRDRAEEQIRLQGRELFRRVHPALRNASSVESRAALAVSSAIAVEGDTITIRVPDIHSSNLCTTGWKEIRAVVKRTTSHATIAQDVAAPSPGFSSSDFTDIGAEFESLMYPTDTLYFGKESDRNGDGRVTILYTPEVNRATPSGQTGFVAGFFWPGDLVKKTEYAQLNIQCPQTNEQEIFYMLVPDPAGTINGNARSVDVVRQNTRGTIAHEFQHMINQGRRLLNPAVDSAETTWLNEALSHFAEEIVGRAKRGFSDFQKLTYNDVNPTPQGSTEDYQAFFRQNLLRYRSWMQRPDTSSPTSNLTASQLAPRGAAWMLLRYTGDFHSGGNLKSFLRKVVGGPDIGLRNLLQHANAQFDDVLSGWLISQFTDGLNTPNVPAAYSMKSWAVRDAMSGVNNNVFPLLVTPLLPSIVDTKSISGSGNYFRLTRSSASPELTFRMQGPSGGMVGFAGARVYVVRIN